MNFLHLEKLGPFPTNEFAAFLEYFWVFYLQCTCRSGDMWIFPHFQLPLLPLLHLPLEIIIFSYSLQIHILGIIAFIQSWYNCWHQLTAGSLSLRGGLQTHAGLGTGFPISTESLNLYDTGMLLCCKLSPRTLYFEISCPMDTLLWSRLSPHKGDNLLQGGHFALK